MNPHDQSTLRSVKCSNPACDHRVLVAEAELSFATVEGKMSIATDRRCPSCGTPQKVHFHASSQMMVPATKVKCTDCGKLKGGMISVLKLDGHHYHFKTPDIVCGPATVEAT